MSSHLSHLFTEIWRILIRTFTKVAVKASPAAPPFAKAEAPKAGDRAVVGRDGAMSGQFMVN